MTTAPTAQAKQPFDLVLDRNEGARRVLIFTEHVNATYFISFDIPMRAMHLRGEVDFAVASQLQVAAQGIGCWIDWAEQFKPNVVVMTRYGLPHGPEILDFFQSRQIPVIYHMDDDLCDIPASLGAEIVKRQGAEDVVTARRYLLAHCDLIYASTPRLAALLAERTPSQRIYHGMYAPYMADALGARAPGPGASADVQTLGYMGSKGHQNDLELAVPALVALMDARPGLRFEVFGTIKMPAALERFGSRTTSHKVNKAYGEFLAHLATLNWVIGLAPLADEAFNQCKAPTKFIEYTAAGIPVIASDVAVYRDAIPAGGGVLVRGDWHQAIENLLDSPGHRASIIATAQAHCAVTFDRTRLERQVRDVLTMATSIGPVPVQADAAPSALPAR